MRARSEVLERSVNLRRTNKWGLGTALLLSVALSCDDGCRCGDQVPEERIQVVDEALVDEVVAVARLLNFDERHFDNQHWWAESVQRGLLVGREDVPGGIAKKPTRQVRRFAADVLGDGVAHVQWERHVDVLVWRAEADGEPWRWAINLPVSDRWEWDEAPPRAEWRYFRRSGGDDGNVTPVFERAVDGEHFQGTYFVAGGEAVGVAAGEPPGHAVTVSNFEAGAARLAEAVGAVGESGSSPAELYVWPGRLGFADRHRRAAQMMEYALSRRGHDLERGPLTLFRRRAQLQRDLSRAEVWPEVVEFSMDIERDEETGAAEVIEVAMRVAGDVGLAAVISEVIDEEHTQRGPVAVDAPGELAVNLGDGAARKLVELDVVDRWLRTLSVRDGEQRGAIADALGELMSHNAGPTTVAFYDSPVPMGMTGEIFVGWQVADGADPDEAARAFHRRLLDDHWRHKFHHADRIFVEQFEEEMEGVEVKLERKNYIIGHGHGHAGVCWTVRDGEYLSFYGVRPCERLREVVDFSASRDADRALSYRGDWRAFVEMIYAKPRALPDEIFGEREMEIDLVGRRQADGSLRFSTEITDILDAAQLVDGIPALGELWMPEGPFDVEELTEEMDLKTPSYQEPALMMLGAPGMGGVLPPSVVLGLPHSYPPLRPVSYREVFFGDPDDDHHDHDHGHDHGHAH